MKRGNITPPEILAPAGSEESLLAAVRCGADAVYLGGKQLNARRGAQNFDKTQLRQAVSYCHARGVRVYYTLNTLIFQEELPLMEQAIAQACGAGVDALIVQDLAVAACARRCAPELELHASTQMSVHNAAGAAMLEKLGFSRVVLARELAEREIRRIADETRIGLECFVHGALCMSVSGQCYLSASLGGRSGNRGLCAQPCRLPFAAGGCTHALSLRDLSAVTEIPRLAAAGVSSLKIEGRLKRPEYVAAAVTACKQALAGETPDLENLQAVFSRGNFTNSYFDEKRGTSMFGTRGKEEVAAAAPVLKKLQALYSAETPLLPVTFSLTVHPGEPAGLTVADRQGNTVTVHGAAAQVALSAPTTPEKAAHALRKTGGTPFFAEHISCDIAPGLMLGKAELNSLRRRALEELLALRGAVSPKTFTEKICDFGASEPPERQELRVRLADREQLSAELLAAADRVILPLEQVSDLPGWALAQSEKLIAELPRILFNTAKAGGQLRAAAERGIRHLQVGNLGGILLGREAGLVLHGDFGLNVANDRALAEYAALGLADLTLSIEVPRGAALALGAGAQATIPRGIIAYGSLPLMLTRNPPGGGSDIHKVTDRMGKTFRVVRSGDAYELLNSVPLYLCDRLEEWRALHFVTLYFTGESAARCREVLCSAQNRTPPSGEFTRGTYYKKVN